MRMLASRVHLRRICTEIQSVAGVRALMYNSLFICETQGDTLYGMDDDMQCVMTSMTPTIARDAEHNTDNWLMQTEVR